MSKDSIQQLIDAEVEKKLQQKLKELEATVIQFDPDSSLAGCMVGKNVLVRSYNEGINCGTVEAADETGVVLKNTRRLWSHRPSDSNYSWYEGVATVGISESSKVSCTVARKVIVERYSMTECKPTAYNSIMEKKPNAQS